MVNNWRVFKGGEMLDAKSGKAGGLLICLNGFWGKSYEPMRLIANKISNDLPNVDILLLRSFDIAAGIWADPNHFVNQHVATIDQTCFNKNYQDIRILAYSMGAAVARKIMVAAFGVTANKIDDLEKKLLHSEPNRIWHKQVKRLTFIAGFARGWIINPRMALPTRTAINAAGIFGHLFASVARMRGSSAPTPTVFALRRGAPFIFNTRMQWLSLMRHANGPGKNLTIVHLIPTRDDYVSAVEVIDVESDQAKRMFCIPVKNSDHRTVLDVLKPNPNVMRRVLRTQTYLDDYTSRYECIISSVARNATSTKAKSPFEYESGFPLNDKIKTMPMRYIDDSLPAAPDPSVSSFVFIIHGIRDTGAWAKKIGATIRTVFDFQQLASKPKSKLRTDTQTYGYFALFPFIWPWVRRQKVEWLMDRYATAKALFPDASMNFVGHSNGTYLAASALRDYQTCKFDRVVFAGSVVPRGFDWRVLKKQQKVLNYVATADVVVAFGTKGLQGLSRGFFDLGSAGHDGFDQADQVANVKYVVGSHGAGIQEHVWGEIADFIVTGKLPVLTNRKDDRFFDNNQSWWVKAVGFASPALVIVLTSFALNLLYGFAEPVFDLPHFAPTSDLLTIVGKSMALTVDCNWFYLASNWVNNFWRCYNALPNPVHASVLLGYMYFLYVLLFKW